MKSPNTVSWRVHVCLSLVIVGTFIDIQKQVSRVSCKGVTGFAAFGKEMQPLISGSAYADTEQLLSRLTSACRILATSQ